MIHLDFASFSGEALSKSASLEARSMREEAPAAAPILTCGLDSGLHRFYESLFDGFGFTVVRAGSRAEAIESLAARAAPVLICAANLSDGNWRDLLLSLRSLRLPPALIVAGETSIWNDVLEAGGFDVLSAPTQQDEVIWTVTAAWHDWMNRTESLRGGARCGGA
jgi:DNA-binding NtrC family response regulator